MHSENAISAKARAMFAGRLTARNYSEMLQCKDVHDVASYLKTKTPYGNYLSGLNTSTVHRGWLEENLKNILFRELDALSHYDFALGDKFYEYFIISGEILQIKRCISLINTGNKEKYMLTFPEFFVGRAHLDLISLAKAESMKDILEVLKGGAYYDICKRFLAGSKESIDLVNMSKALDEYKYDRLFEIINTTTKGGAKKELNAFAQLLVDLYNIEAIERNNRFKRHNSSLMSSSVTISGGAINQQTLEQMAQAKTQKELFEAVKKTKYRKYIKDEDYAFVEMLTASILYNKSIHELRFSPHPLVVMMAYASLAQTEISNVVHIVEGIRYNVQSERIAAILVGADK